MKYFVSRPFHPQVLISSTQTEKNVINTNKESCVFNTKKNSVILTDILKLLGNSILNAIWKIKLNKTVFNFVK